MLKLDCVTIHPTYVACYSELYTDSGESYSCGNKNIQHHLSRNNSKLSTQSIKKIRKALSYMEVVTPIKSATNKKFNSTYKFRLTFITLTLSARQQHTDQEIKSQLLHPFLDYIQKVCKVKCYIWKAERQKNKNIHFHIVLDQYIAWQKVQYRWNVLQDKLGYITEYYKNNPDKLPAEVNRTKYYSVNSTDIHSTKNVKQITHYILKYILKDPQLDRQRIKDPAIKEKNKEQIERPKLSDNTKKFLKSQQAIGQLWNCSNNLKNLTGGKSDIHAELRSEIDVLLSDSSLFIKKESYFSFISFDFEYFKKLNLPHLSTLLNEFLAYQFNFTPLPS